jgi:hypothetical protein
LSLSLIEAIGLEVAGRQRVEAAEVTFGQIGRDAHERLALLGRQQAGRIGYHAARSMQPAAQMSLRTCLRSETEHGTLVR